MNQLLPLRATPMSYEPSLNHLMAFKVSGLTFFFHFLLFFTLSLFASFFSKVYKLGTFQTFIDDLLRSL